MSARDHVRGPARAPVTLVEYGDFQCPVCGRAYWALKALEQRYARDLRVVFRHFPLTEIHPLALPAHEASEAAAEQDKFWEMHDILFENQPSFDPSSLVSYAAALGLDIDPFFGDLRTHHYLPRIRDDFMSGVRSGVNGTPTLFINGERFDGLPQIEVLAAAIDAERRQAQAAHPG